MNKIIILVIALAMYQCSFAKIWRVNNVAGVTADFTTVQAAHDAAGVVNGDTLHIEPSISNYGSLVMTKRLTIISIGDFLSVNPGSQYALVTGTISFITINNASASNAVFHCNVAGSFSLSVASNVRIERCNIGGNLSISNNSNNDVVVSSYLQVVSLTNATNIIITNNIVTSYIDVSSTASATVVNNVIFATAGQTNRIMNNSTFQNNILNKTGTYTFTNSIVENNIASSTTLPAGNGNQNSVTMTNVFVNASGNDDASFVLQTSGGNPAIGAGIGGVDCGAYGGANPFKRGLQPAIPAIYKLSAPAAPVGNTMNVIFSTKSNN